MTEKFPLAGAHICHDMGQESLTNPSEEVFRLEEYIRGWLIGDWRLGDIRVSENGLCYDSSESYLDFYYVNPGYRPGKGVKDVRTFLKPDILNHVSELKKDDFDGFAVNLDYAFLRRTFDEVISQSRHQPTSAFVGLTRVREKVAEEYVDKDHVLAVLLFMTDEVKYLRNERKGLSEKLRNTQRQIAETDQKLRGLHSRQPLY